MTSGTLRLDVPVDAETLYDYLTDPHNRPHWQASLRAVEQVKGDGGVGSSWIDVTAVGAQPRMQVIAAERPGSWAERGRWQGLSAELTLEFVAYAPGRTRLLAHFRVAGAGVFGLAAPILQMLAGPAIEADLRRAVRLAATA